MNERRKEGRKECFVRPGGEVGSFSIHHCSVERRLRRWKCWTYEFNLALRDDYNSKYTYQLENCTEKETIMQEIINENVVCKQIDSIDNHRHLAITGLLVIR